jgi:hypothetical protein
MPGYMLRKYRKWIIASLILAIFCVSAYGAYQIYWMELRHSLDSPPELIESKSPAGLGVASFLVEDAFIAKSLYFYVRDPARSMHPLPVNKSREYGYASDGDVDMTQAVWSEDGSVIAVRAKVESYGTFFVDAYDFKKHQAVGNELPVRQKSKLIKDLIRNRGGEGKIAVKEPYAEGDIISESQANEFKK